MNWLLARLKEASTWRGIILLLTVCGMKLEPDQQEAIIAAGLAVVGLIGVLTRDEQKQVNINLPPIEMQSHSKDDGYISRDVLRSRLYVPPNHITGTQYDERQTRFQRYDDPDDYCADPVVRGVRDAVPAEAPSQVVVDNHETGFNS